MALVGIFQFPADVVFGRMFPGTAFGVLIGNLLYTLMARRLAARSGRDDVTAMPLGLDAPPASAWPCWCLARPSSRSSSRA